jgi:hypothetical protein
MNPYPYTNPYAQPQPPPAPPPGYGYPPQPGGRQQDEQNLDALAICHFIYAGLVGLGALLVGLWLLFATVLTTRVATSRSGGPEAAAIVGIVDVVLGVVLVLILAKAVLLAYSGVCLRRRRNRTLSFVLACITCINIPLGTVLGVFTLVVLSRPSVKALYEQTARYGAPPGAAGLAAR